MKPILEVITLLISISAFLAGLVTWYGGSVQKRYAAQRDYEHLKTSYKQLAANQEAILRELDRRFDENSREISDVKGLINAVLVKVSPDSNTGGWMRKPKSL